jgi:hypothetical protein
VVRSYRQPAHPAGAADLHRTEASGTNIRLGGEHTDGRLLAAGEHTKTVSLGLEPCCWNSDGCVGRQGLLGV